MGQKSEAYFDNMAMFTFHKPILLIGVWARNSMMDSMGCKVVT
jgi:hypothetical protein